MSDDEYIRTGVTLDSVSAVRPAFKKDGTVTAANASGINDGAAALVLMTADEAARRNAPVLARVARWAHAGVDPPLMGIGPVPATQRALQQAGWPINDRVLVDANEAVAGKSLSHGEAHGVNLSTVHVIMGALSN